MKADELFEIFGDIDDDKIGEAENYRKPPRRRIFLKWGAFAACFAVVAVLSLQVQKEQEANINGDIVVENPVKEKTNNQAETKEKQKDNPQTDNEEKQQDNPVNDAITNGYGDDTQIKSDDTEQSENYAESADDVSVGESVTEDTDEIFGGESVTEDTDDSFREESVTEDTDSEEEYPAPGSGGGGGSSSSGMNKEVVEDNSPSETITGIFGGAYYDENGNYVVVITEDTPENRKLIADELKVDVNTTLFKKGEYTLAYLTALQEKISNAMINGEIPFVMTSAVVETSNRIEVSVTTDDESELAKVRQLDTIGGAIVFTYTEECFDTFQ